MRLLERVIPRTDTILLCALLWPAQPALAQKLIGTGAIGNANQGSSVALSRGSNTIIVGGHLDNAGAGAAWVFALSPAQFTQQAKLVGSGAVGNAHQGASVALSGDGNTAIIGGPADNTNAGAAWVFTRSGTTWIQQQKLIGTGAIGVAQQGASVALSDDGNTAIVGGPNDNNTAGDNSIGAAWVFTRSGTTWSQQAKLVGTGVVGFFGAAQGSVALSADGNTAIVGGLNDNTNAGAAWVFTRSGGVWSQQGNKLVGSGAVGNALQGGSVALSADGNTAIVGGPGDDTQAGAAWVFTRSGGVWTQQGKLNDVTRGKATLGASVALSGGGNTALVGAPEGGSNNGSIVQFTRSGGAWSEISAYIGGAVGAALQGSSVALSCNTGLWGGPGDDNNVGAAWAGYFALISASRFIDAHDFNGDCMSDILWRSSNGGIAAWLMNGENPPSAVGVGSTTSDWAIVGQRDFNGDGYADILFQNINGSIVEWLMSNGTISSAINLGNPGTGWSVVGTGDFNSDGIGDILLRGGGTAVALWFMNNSGMVASTAYVGSLPSDWTVAFTGDFNGDGMCDILWYNSTSGEVAAWLMYANGTVMSAVTLDSLPVGTWKIAGVGDFNRDGITDILLYNSSGGVRIWFMNRSGTIQSRQDVGSFPTDWTIIQTGDFNGDGISDIAWYNGTSGGVALWLMNGATITSVVSVGSLPPWFLDDPEYQRGLMSQSIASGATRANGVTSILLRCMSQELALSDLGRCPT